MKAAPFDYAAPTTLDEAVMLLADHGEDARPIAGGQSLVPMLALRLARPAMLVDLNRIEGLAGITVEADALRIGAMTRQADVLRSPEIAAMAPLLVAALGNVGHPPTRARGTVGGSMAHADPAAELPVALAALDAEVIVRGGNGERVVPAGEFVLGAFETALAPGEIVVAIRVPKARGGTSFLEISPRKGDFAIICVAVRLDCDPGGLCRSCALALGGVADRPIRCGESERALTGRSLDDLAIAEAVAALPLGAITMESRLASAGYRQRVAPVLAERALRAAFADCNGART